MRDDLLRAEEVPERFKESDEYEDCFLLGPGLEVFPTLTPSNASIDRADSPRPLRDPAAARPKGHSIFGFYGAGHCACLPPSSCGATAGEDHSEGCSAGGGEAGGKSA